MTYIYVFIYVLVLLVGHTTVGKGTHKYCLVSRFTLYWFHGVFLFILHFLFCSASVPVLFNFEASTLWIMLTAGSLGDQLMFQNKIN